MDGVDDILKMIQESKFCYQKAYGEGYVRKSDCTCTATNPCQAIIDKSRFHQLFDEIEESENGNNITRREIIQKMKPEFKESIWWIENIIE